MVDVEVLAPTMLEYLLLRRVAPELRVHRCGVALSRWRGCSSTSAVVVCGLAGALDPGLAPGTIIVPRTVGQVDGPPMACDPELVQRLMAGARALGFDPVGGCLLTASGIVTGRQRERYRRLGFVAADMETALLSGSGRRVAALRVILDAPTRSIAADWAHPLSAALRPALWAELLWLCRDAPLYAWHAARVVQAAMTLAGPYAEEA